MADNTDIRIAGVSRRLFGTDAEAAQVAALPWRRGRDGVEILLVTSRGTGRWIIPKGWAERGELKNEAAAREAWEEAGVVGITPPAVVGAFSYDKLLRSGNLRHCHVEVFALEVNRVDDIWPEMCERDRRWFALARAAEACGEPALTPIIASFRPARAA